MTASWCGHVTGASPYPGVSASQVFQMVTKGQTMDRPQHCTEKL